MALAAGVWGGRSRVSASFWRLYFVVMIDGEPFGTVSTFSWLNPDVRGSGLGKEMRQAVLHLAFAGLRANEASSDAFVDIHASNRVSEALGYMPNGVTWDNRRGECPGQIQRWRLTREQWIKQRRGDIELVAVADCLPVLGIDPPLPLLNGSGE